MKSPTKKTPMESKTEKLQKILANAGLASRREIETWIEEGRVSINGKIATLGDRAIIKDKIRVDGRIVNLNKTAQQVRRVILYNKPEGEICTRNDPEGRDTVFAHLPRLHNGRWIMIGRLDINTSGLLLFTNDGELANRLMHPSFEVTRTYAVRVLGEVDKAMLQRLRNGVALEDGEAKFDSIREAGGTGANHWYHVTLKEGRNREVRRLWESQGVQVSRLTRITFANITLPRDVRLGRWDELDLKQVNQLAEQVQLPPQTAKPIRKHKRQLPLQQRRKTAKKKRK